jgi:outer membrane protein TolC
MGMKRMHYLANPNNLVRRRREPLRPGWTVAIAALVLCSAVGAPIAEAQVTPIVVDPMPVEAAASRNIVIQEGGLMLSLNDAIAIALQQNLGLRVERYSVEQNDYWVLANQGIFDVALRSELGAFDETTPSATDLDGADVQEQNGEQWNFGADALISTGGTFSFDWNNTRFETNSIFASLNPSYRSDVDLSFSQPLLRDFGERTTKRNLLIANTNREISHEQFEQQVVETAQAVEDAYWLLLEAQNQLLVAEEALRLAEEFHEQNEVRVEVGTVAPLELIQSEAGVATRKEELIRARFAVDDRADDLRQLMNLEEGQLWEAPIVCTTEAEIEPVEVDLDEAIQSAMENRPEIRSQILNIQRLQIDSDYFTNQRRARLDLGVTYGLNGVGGDIQFVDPETGEPIAGPKGGWEDAMKQIGDADFDGWSAGLNFLYPIRNRTAKGNAIAAELAVEQGEVALRELELQVRTEVRRALRVVKSSEEAIASARVSRRLELKNLEAEEKRYDNGMSTAYRVLEIQEDLTAARGRYIASVATYRRSLAALLRVSGTLMKYRDIEILQPDDEQQ